MSLHERNWPCRLMWVFSLAGVTVLGKASFQTIALVWLLCGLATLLAIRDIRSISELAGLRFAYDDARERYLNMQRNTPTPTKPDCDYFSNLTKRELAIVRLVAQGKDNHEIATELFLSEGTVRNHISSVLAKKNLSNRTQLAVAYYQETSH
ncbi:response regulator transcription factor [Eggerthellaceae bacterium 3-80]|nr:DNA-binding response regulator [bacterium D16-34]